MDGVRIQTEACPGFNSEQVDFTSPAPGECEPKPWLCFEDRRSWIARGVKFVLNPLPPPIVAAC